jgi:lipoate---protein ligase
MKLLDLSLPSGEENLALDEALLDECERNPALEALRFWEPAAPFVVLGHGNRRRSEVDLEACQRLGVPVFRRCSGGGTVLQAPGCLNYSLLLALPETGPLSAIHGTNQFIMHRHRELLERLLNRPVAVNGITDLTVIAAGFGVPPSGGPNAPIEKSASPVPPESGTRNLAGAIARKFSGNAQRRRKRALLFHGTFLLDVDLALLSRVLAHPPHAPDYREQRSHADFVANIPLTARRLKQALIDLWQARESFSPPPMEAMRALLENKYSRREWHEKF